MKCQCVIIQIKTIDKNFHVALLTNFFSQEKAFGKFAFGALLREIIHICPLESIVVEKRKEIRIKAQSRESKQVPLLENNR